MKHMIKRIALFLGAVFVAAPFFMASIALAQTGPGTYRVKGYDAKAKDNYTGSATLTQTGQNTWRVSWKIGKQNWTGYGIGDGKIVAINYTGGSTGVVLLIEKDGGKGYNAVWANSGDTVVGTEDWSPAD